jgi:uncharacterized protein with HEPN domain
LLSKHFPQCLLDIIENAGRVICYTEGMNERSLAADRKTLDAVERCLQRISEAAIRLGEVKAEQLMPGQPWQDIRGIGNHLRHAYSALDSGMIWEAVEGCVSLAEDSKRALEQVRRDSGEGGSPSNA